MLRWVKANRLHPISDQFYVFGFDADLEDLLNRSPIFTDVLYRAKSLNQFERLRCDLSINLRRVLKFIWLSNGIIHC